MYPGTYNEGGLYSLYIRYCRDMNYEACSYNKFITELLTTLHAFSLNVSKVRQSAGFYIRGISKEEGELIGDPDFGEVDELQHIDRWDVKSWENLIFSRSHF